MLYVIATPVGNLGDMTSRAIEALREADAIACEDTRRTWILLSHFGIPRPGVLLSYRQGNEERVGERILGLLNDGKIVALCSDGGYPGISDPGYRLIALAIDNGIELDVFPGASAVPLALLQSGLPTSSYTFKGYPPRKPGARRHWFEAERDLPHTLVAYESPYRVTPCLESALEALGDRRAAVCIELTKKFQRVSRGFLSELADEFRDVKVKGEVAIVVAGNNPKFARPLSSAPPDQPL